MARSQPRSWLDRPRFRDVDVRETALQIVREEGHIPSSLQLCLQNAANVARAASWDICVGRDGLVVQCNLDPERRFTWHAGRRLAPFVAGGTDVFYQRTTKIYDASTRAFTHPKLPSGAIMQSGNPETIGIELECWGRVIERRGVYWKPLGGGKRARLDGVTHADVVAIGDDLYHRITPEQHRALVAVARAYRDFFDIAPSGWYRHSEIRPDNRVDPEPPLDVARFIETVYADRAPTPLHGPDLLAMRADDEDSTFDPDEIDAELDSEDERDC